MADYVIRRAARADLPAMAAADPRLETDPARAGHVGAWLDLGLSWVAEEGGAVIGYVIATRQFYTQPFVDLLVVDEGRRRRGVGTALMARAETDCRPDDSRIFTSTNESNAPMRTLLAMAGWQVSGIIENLDPGDPELVFVKFRE